MEVEGMKRIFRRSLLKRNVKYVKYIGDGDTKTFPKLQNTVSYNLEKIECVGNTHTQKLMGARLRKLKLTHRGKKLLDGKSISGKNCLTDKLIDKFTTYYRNAIRENCSSTYGMRQSIWAITAQQMKNQCPGWCFFMIENYKHNSIENQYLHNYPHLR
ncbi:uncharacterized protein TNCV_2093861 [Trichonephila clavipes]|nr:uncharacterized protein TNCV_2093861 [Trichonephila clavipes]